MRIEITPSAKAHGILDAEIRAAITYYALSLPIAARKTAARPFFYTAPAAPNQPWIEVIADHVDPTTAIVFHAMMLRPTLVASLGISHLIDPEYGPQRA
jgi:hypothetical protein